MRKACIAPVLLLVFLISGCGGGGGGVTSPLHISGSGYLGNSQDTVYSSGLYVDQVAFTATRNGRITVTMSQLGSDTVDPQIYVVKNDAYYTLVTSDDDSGEGLNAVCSFTAVAGQAYYAWFTTASKYDSGTYAYTISEVESTRSPDLISKEATKPLSGTRNTYESLMMQKTHASVY